ncbi:hypothetical protein QFC22_006407, partial [Naganishia vaughanmartiniae]
MPLVRVKPGGKATKRKGGIMKEERKTATVGGKRKGKKKDTDIHQEDACKQYMADDRPITPTPAGKKDKTPRSVPKMHISHLLRANVFVYHHVNICILLLALCLPHDPLSNLWNIGFGRMSFVWPELIYMDRVWAQEDEENAKHPDRKKGGLIKRVQRDGLMAAIVSEEQLSKNDDAHELVFTMAEITLLMLFPQDGYQNQPWWTTDSKKAPEYASGSENVEQEGKAQDLPAVGEQVMSERPGEDGRNTAVNEEERQMNGTASKDRVGDKVRDVVDGEEATAGAHEEDGDQGDGEREPTPICRVDELKGELEAEEGEEQDSGLGWPSRTFKSIQWLIVQANTFWDSFPQSWKNHYTDNETRDVLTPGQMSRMFDRTDFGNNGLNYLGHLDKSLQHVLAVFIEVFEEDPLDTQTGWWSDRGRILEWELKPKTRSMMARMLFGMGCMQHHPEDSEQIMPSLKEPYDTILKAQESRLTARVHRQVKRLQGNVIPDREAYLALTICARLASIPDISLAAFTSEMRLKDAVKEFIDTGILKASELEESYRWPRAWHTKDMDLPEDEKSMKSQSSEWNLYFLGDKGCPQPFDTILKQRRAKISRALLKLVLPLNVRGMVSVLKKLDSANVSLDLQMLAFHEHFFVNATKHVRSWITRHPSVKKGELGLSLAWGFFQHSASHFSVVSNAVGSLITWQSASLLEPYATQEVRSNIRAVAATAVQELTADILAPLYLYDSTTRTLGLSATQVSNKLIASLMGFDLSKTWWPSLQKSNLPGIAPIAPTRSQILGAFSVIPSIYAADEDAGNHSRSNGRRNGVAQFVNDTVGMGKTLQAFMIITGLFHLQTTLKVASAKQTVQGSDTRGLVFLPPILLKQRKFLEDRLPPHVRADFWLPSVQRRHLPRIMRCASEHPVFLILDRVDMSSCHYPEVDILKAMTPFFSSRVEFSLPSDIQGYGRGGSVPKGTVIVYVSSLNFTDSLSLLAGTTTLDLTSKLIKVTSEDLDQISSFPTEPGATNQPLDICEGLYKATSFDPILIVVPKSVINQWQAEWTKFIDGTRYSWIRLESMTELIAKQDILGSLEDECPQERAPTIIITTYSVISRAWSETQKKDPPEHSQRLFDLTYTCLLADEAHRCRNIKTEEAKALMDLSSRSKTRVFLSATAITNSVQDLVNIFKVMAHPAIVDPKLATSWKGVENRLKEASACRRRYRSAVLPSLGPEDWYRHVEAPPTAAQASRGYEIIPDSYQDPDALYTQGHFEDLLQQRELAREAKNKALTLEEDRTGLVAKSKAHRQSYENNESLALAEIMREVGGSILRRGKESQVYLPSAYQQSGYLKGIIEDKDKGPILETCNVQRRRYRVLPDQGERDLVTKLLMEETTVREPEEEESGGEADDDDDAESPAAIQTFKQKDAFYTLGRQASIYLNSAKHSGTPVEIKDGRTVIVASAKMKEVVEICLRIVNEDKDKPEEKRRKICIYIRWTSGFPIIQYHLLRAGLGSVTLSGSDSAQERDRIVQKMQQPTAHMIDVSTKNMRGLQRDQRTKKAPLLLHSNILILSEAGGEGLNLTRISEVIVMDGMWSPADGHQLEGRFARRGQTLPVIMHYLETPGTADEPMKLALQQKAALYDITVIFDCNSFHDTIQRDARRILEGLSDLQAMIGSANGAPEGNAPEAEGKDDKDGSDADGKEGQPVVDGDNSKPADDQTQPSVSDSQKLLDSEAKEGEEEPVFTAEPGDHPDQASEMVRGDLAQAQAALLEEIEVHPAFQLQDNRIGLQRLVQVVFTLKNIGRLSNKALHNLLNVTDQDDAAPTEAQSLLPTGWYALKTLDDAVELYLSQDNFLQGRARSLQKGKKAQAKKVETQVK